MLSKQGPHPGQMVFSLPCVFILHKMADEVLVVSVCVQVQRSSFG